uniref:Uncharacterized protein n=1 Tax=Photinus pyralis TaxID=7054 RepID=A0A1Y1KJ57_PHOPY
MGFDKAPLSSLLCGVFIFLLIILESQSARLEDIFNLNQQPREEREAQYYPNRYGSDSSVQKVSSLTIKPEDNAEARERENANIGKRCIRCDYYNRDYYRYPYEYRGRYDDKYDRYDRYDDRYYRDGYDDRGRDRYYDDYDKRYYDVRRYNDDRRYDTRDRYDRDRYDRRPDYYDYYYPDRGNDRDRYDKDDRYRYRNDDRYYVKSDSGYRPWDETTRGTSGFDNSGRGYYFAVGRPEYSTGYASGWNTYDDRNNSRDRWRDQGFSSGSHRPRDPYDTGYRGTSYLYGRPSSTTTTESPGGGGGPTDNPDSQSNTSSG